MLEKILYDLIHFFIELIEENKFNYNDNQEEMITLISLLTNKSLESFYELLIKSFSFYVSIE